jgi:hypothetical protein
LDGNRGFAVGFFLESLLGCLYNFVHDGNIDGSELFFEEKLDDFVEFSEEFSEFGVKMIFDAVVCSLT